MFIRPQGEISGVAMYVQRPNRVSTQAVMRHEAFHQFAHNFLGRTLPHTIDEGIAQYFEKVIVVDGQVHAGLVNRHWLEGVQQMIEKDRVLPLDTLLHLSSTQWEGILRDHPELRGELYLQAWSLVHFLVHGDDGHYREPFENYLELISKGRQSRQALREAFGVDSLSAAEESWRRFFAELEPDPVMITQAHLLFLADGLLRLHDRRGHTPETFDELRIALRVLPHGQTYPFSPSVRVSYSAEDDRTFQYPVGEDEWRNFQLLEPTEEGDPPAIVAPEARWRPTLVWSRDGHGNLVYDIEYHGERSRP